MNIFQSAWTRRSARKWLLAVAMTTAACGPRSLAEDVTKLDAEERPSAATLQPPLKPDRLRADDKRLPVPDEAAARVARQAVASIFEAKAKKSHTPEEWTAVGREMFDALPSIEDPTERYVLQIAALDVASRGNDAQLLFNIADSLATNYKVERTVLLAPCLTRLPGTVTPEAWESLSSNLTNLLEQCLTESRFEEAGSVINAYIMLGKRAKDPRVSVKASLMRKSATERKRASERIAELLAAAQLPDAEPRIFTELGRMMCFVNGDWEAGLQFLAKCPDAGLSRCAAMDQAAGSPAQKLAAADAWAHLASQVPQAERDPYHDRAISIYSQILPTLSGLAKLKAEKALDSIVDDAAIGSRDQSAWVVIFRSDDPSKWNTDSQRDPKNFAIPLASIPDTVRFVRLRRTNGAVVIIPATKNSLTSEVTGDIYGWQGARRDYWGASPLGIFDTRDNVFGKVGKVAVYHSGDRSFSGWGFGHRIVVNRDGERAQLCWGGDLVPLEPLEIAVTSKLLNATDRGFLLK